MKYSDLSKIVDDGTTVVYIATPKNWKCKRKGCKADYKHTHSTYNCLTENEISNKGTLTKKRFDTSIKRMVE